jgi:hypothetical protein
MTVIEVYPIESADYYKDEGCEAFSSCLSCPLPECLEEKPGGRQKWLKDRRNKEAWGYYQKGKSTAEIANLMGLSQRTVQRIVRSKKGE